MLKRKATRASPQRKKVIRIPQRRKTKTLATTDVNKLPIEILSFIFTFVPYFGVEWMNILVICKRWCIAFKRTAEFVKLDEKFPKQTRTEADIRVMRSVLCATSSCYEGWEPGVDLFVHACSTCDDSIVETLAKVVACNEDDTDYMCNRYFKKYILPALDSALELKRESTVKILVAHTGRAAKRRSMVRAIAKCDEYELDSLANTLLDSNVWNPEQNSSSRLMLFSEVRSIKKGMGKHMLALGEKIGFKIEYDMYGMLSLSASDSGLMTSFDDISNFLKQIQELRS